METLNCIRCDFRHKDNGNCSAVGGFCTAVAAAHCPMLQKYLDTGLGPDEVTALQKDWSDLCTIVGECGGIDRLRELAEADKDGRLVVLPCKMGDAVYWVHGAVITECKVYRVQKNRKGLYICLKSNVSHGAFRAALCFGKSIFLTREEAEKVLEARNETDHYLQGRV